MSLNKKPLLLPGSLLKALGRLFLLTVMAGLGESCSHVASLLWAIESGVRIQDSMTATQKKACWVIPNGVKEVPYARVRDIEFTGKKKCWAAVETGNYPINSRSSCSSMPRAIKITLSKDQNSRL